MNRVQRQSNIEVLRIMAMFMILLGHAWYHYEKELGDYPLKYFTYHVINPLLYMHVDIFVMITGYFGLKFKIGKLLGLYTTCMFYTLLALIVTLIIPNCGNFRWRALVFPVSQGDWWFIRIYISLMLISPMLNLVVEKCKESHNWRGVLLVIVLLDFYASWFHKIDGLYSMGFDLVNFASIYLLGRYIKICGLPLSLNKMIIALFSLCLIKIGLSEICFTFPKIDNFLRINTYCNPINVCSAMLMVAIFCKWKINWSNKWINYVSSSTLAVYLMTDNRYIRGELTNFTERWYSICIGGGESLFLLTLIHNNINEHFYDLYYI